MVAVTLDFFSFTHNFALNNIVEGKFDKIAVLCGNFGGRYENHNVRRLLEVEIAFVYNRIIMLPSIFKVTNNVYSYIQGSLY